MPIMAIIILVLGGFGAVAITDKRTNDVNIKQQTIILSEPTIKDAENFIKVSLKEGTTSILKTGEPNLPVVTKVFTFPFGTTITSVDVSYSQTSELKLLKEVEPAPEPVLLNEELQTPSEPMKDPIVYESREPYPSSGFDYIAGSGLQGNEHVLYLQVQLYPVRYFPTLNTIYYSLNANINIIYEEPVNPITFEDIYDLVIIAPSGFSSGLQPLIDHKNSNEVETILKTTQDIYAEYDAYDEAEEIKYFIKDAIDDWGVDYVLLVGDVYKIPIRETWFFDEHHGEYYNRSILTEMYYSGVYDEYGAFCSWDSDGDGLYGETYDDNLPGVDDIVDLYPDVHIGRLPCEDDNDVNIVVDKIIYYETNTYGESWYDNMLFIGGDTFPGWNGNEGEILNNMVEQLMPDFNPTKLWTSDGTFTAGAVNQNLNNGVGFVDYSGHGFELGVATHPPDDESWVKYNTLHLLGLLNNNKLPIIFFDACSTSKLDYTLADFFGSTYQPYSNPETLLLNIEPEQVEELIIGATPTEPILDTLVPCFAWRFLNKEIGGAIATIGATRIAFGGFDSGAGKLSLEFFATYDECETIGQMMTGAQIGYVEDVPYDKFTVEEFILIGDPSVKIGGYEEETSFSFFQKDLESTPSSAPSSPVNQQVINPLLQMILERFPNAFPILRYLLGL